MTRDDVLAALKDMGTAQNRKVYARHGVSLDMYGVSFANFKTLKKKIKTSQPLAEALWATANWDARVLAAMIADPRAIPVKTLQAWAKDLGDYCLCDQFAALAAQSPHARKLADQWMAAKGEWRPRAGYATLAHLALGEANGIEDAWFFAALKRIEPAIHAAPNYAKAGMNHALIAIGCRNEALRDQALAAARRIGKVEVDHGLTSCKTPNAETYILKTLEHRRRKKPGCA